jgi:hypothetical protein
MSKTQPLPAGADFRLTDRYVQIGAWTLSVAVSLLALMAWAKDYSWPDTAVSTLQLFPLLGLVAFSIMWSHYINGALSELFGAGEKALARYYQLTGYLVLVLLCLHPGILIFQLFRDDCGLPPSSYSCYVAPGLSWVTMLGTVSLLIFLAYEFKRFFGKQPWWHFVTEAGDIAMLAILYHGLRLGGQLTHQGWYRDVWFFFAVTLVAVLIRSYKNKYFNK